MAIYRNLAFMITVFFIVTSISVSKSYAGTLELKLKNINGAELTPGIDSLTGVTTLDHPDLINGTIIIDNPTDPHAPPRTRIGKLLSNGVALANERVVTLDHMMEAHFEINARRIDPDGILPEFLPRRFIVLLEVEGATFKNQLNGEDIIREGMADEGNYIADVLSNTGKVGDNIVEILVNNTALTQQTDFGLLVPLMFSGGDNDQLTPCVPITLKIQLFSTVGINGAQLLGPADQLTILDCKESIGFEAQGNTVKADFQSDFKKFTTPAYETVTDRVTLGTYQLKIWPNLIDTKATFDSPDRRIGFDDIEEHTITLQFEDLTGLQQVVLTLGDSDTQTIDISASLDRNNNTAIFVIPGNTLTRAQLAELQSIQNHNSGEIKQVIAELSINARIDLIAFPPNSKKFETVENISPKGEITTQIVPTGAGAITYQQVLITENFLKLREPCKERQGDRINGFIFGGDTAILLCTLPLQTGEFASIDLTGEHFGPFDWLNHGNSQIRNYFRVSHIPLLDGHGNDVEFLKGIMTFKNSSGTGLQSGDSFDGNYRFELPLDRTAQNTGSNGVYLIGPGVIAKILQENGAPGIDFGVSDVSFTFFLNSDIRTPEDKSGFSSNGFNLEVDRLLLSNGTMSNFGDNANDSFSDYAVSGDQGRFGQKTPLKLDK